MVAVFIVSREDESFNSLDSNKILLIIKSAFLLNNRNSRLHLFIDRCMVKTKKGNKIQDIAKTAAHITKITFTVPNSEIILMRSSSDLFCTAVLLSPRLDCLEIPPVSFYLILHRKGTNFNLSNIARAIYKKSSFHLLTFKFVPLTISLLLSVDLHPGRSLLAQAPIFVLRIGALLCLLPVSKHKRRLCNLFIHRLPCASIARQTLLQTHGATHDTPWARVIEAALGGSGEGRSFPRLQYGPVRTKLLPAAM